MKRNTRFPTWRESVYGLEYGLLPKSATKPPFFQDALPKYPILVLLNAKSKVENNYCRWLYFTGNRMSMCRLLHFWSLPKTFFMTTKAKIIPYLIQKKNKKKHKKQSRGQNTKWWTIRWSFFSVKKKKRRKKKASRLDYSKSLGDSPWISVKRSWYLRPCFSSLRESPPHTSSPIRSVTPRPKRDGTPPKLTSKT